MRNHLGPGVIGAAGLGAGLMFFLDPDISNRRRAILRDKLVSLGHLAGWAADKTARGVRNCLNGALQSIRSRVRDTPPSDVVLMERVRSKMGRAVSHPHAIHVNVQNGRVRLTGEILSEELDDLIRSVSAVKGVKEIENQLTTYAEPGDISSLQGGYTRRGSRSDYRPAPEHVSRIRNCRMYEYFRSSKFQTFYRTRYRKLRMCPFSTLLLFIDCKASATGKFA